MICNERGAVGAAMSSGAYGTARASGLCQSVRTQPGRLTLIYIRDAVGKDRSVGGTSVLAGLEFQTVRAAGRPATRRPPSNQPARKTWIRARRHGRATFVGLGARRKQLPRPPLLGWSSAHFAANSRMDPYFQIVCCARVLRARKNFHFRKAHPHSVHPHFALRAVARQTRRARSATGNRERRVSSFQFPVSSCQWGCHCRCRFRIRSPTINHQLSTINYPEGTERDGVWTW